MEARHIGMDNIAEQTGGHAYYNTNDLKFAMQRSLENGSEYYTLAYVPPNGADSKYHRINIHFERHGFQAEHRKGYFAMPVKHTTKALDLSDAVRPITPVMSNLHLKAQLSPPDQKRENTGVDCTISAENLTFVDQPNDRKLVTLHLLTVAWDKYLNQAANVSNTVELRFSPEQYSRMLSEGITVHQELHLPPGKYDVRMAVMDAGNDKVGSLEIPLEIPPDHDVARKNFR
jgi:hypothetical protein